MRLLLALLSSILFRVAFVGDPQVDSETEVSYARESILSELRSRSDLNLIVFLGDIVNEKTSLMPAMRASFDSLPCPWVCARGNHDRKQPYQHHFGPLDTTFEMKGIKFLILDNADGWLQPAQAAMIDSVYAATPASQKLVTISHIPVEHASVIATNRADEKRPYAFPSRGNTLYVAGHTHTVYRLDREDGSEELVAGASCGSWWRGVKGSDGIPYALQGCGSPRNYFVVDFDGRGEHTIHFKAVGNREQCSIHRDSSGLFVNIYGGHRDGKVTLRPAGSCRRVELRRCDSIAPEVRRVIDLNASLPKEKKNRRNPDYLPMLKRASSHLWHIETPTAAADTYIVRYRDRSMKFKRTVTIKSE